MRLKSIELSGFKSFARKTELQFSSAITSIVGPNGSGKSNVAESFRFVLGEQSMKSMRGKRGEDMIWNGSTSSPRVGRASVKLVFDNADRVLNLDFDEVAIERVVYRDGANDYKLNGSVVRLRDVSELLSQANIGASGHHIISQGEADRILSATPRERREMIEDALGLTAYLYKREEAERKLLKTAENMRTVEGLRRELAPHVKFLQLQMKKIEDSQKLREDVTAHYLEYLKRESVYLRISKEMIDAKYEAPEREHRELDQKISFLRTQLAKKSDDERTVELVHLEEEGRDIARRRDSATRELGRIEGEVSAHERIAEVSLVNIPMDEVQAFASDIETELEGSLTVGMEELQSRIKKLLEQTKAFIQKMTHAQSQKNTKSMEELTQRKDELEAMLAKLVEEDANCTSKVATLRRAIEGEKDASRQAERELFLDMARRSELETTLNELRGKKELLARESELFKSEVGEAAALVGRAVMEYENTTVRQLASAGEQGDGFITEAQMIDEPRAAQEDRRRKLERMKIRLEEAGLGNSAEIMREHQETKERDDFLARELLDLESSTQSLRELIEELSTTLSARFSDGVAKINVEFGSYFKLMFGGGTAALSLIKETALRRSGDMKDLQDEDSPMDDEDDTQEKNQQPGVELSVMLPHKRVKGIDMLSGGERALTSIALIFAMSQVNPPPFLILDETDAALDEANSRRYGDLIATLAAKSQLILITHNRETMSRAGILYGITMGSDGISKLLSVKFEDALAVAK